MSNPWQRYLDAAGGLTDLTRKAAERIVQRLVQQGELAAEKAERYVDELLARSEDNRKAISAMVRSETERAVARLGLARQEDLDGLAERVARLESERATAVASGPGPGGKHDGDGGVP